MTNRYDKIPSYDLTKLFMYQELTDRQIEYVETEIEKAALENKHKVYIDLISFHSGQKRKLGQVLKSKGYKLVEESIQSIIIDL